MAAEGDDGKRQPAAERVKDKYLWTLVGPEGVKTAEFQQYVLNDLAAAAGDLLRGANSVRVTLQEPHLFSGATVRLGAGDRRIDAVLQITSSAAYEATDAVNSVLSGNCGHAQGWRVHQTIIADVSPPMPLGKPLEAKQTLWFNQRLDGTTPEHYDRNWYIHAGHPDGKEAESQGSRANLERQGDLWRGKWYIQNRVREPITPTQWVINGISDLMPDHFLAGPGERYDPKAGMGEDSFDRWPPRLVQGYTYWVK